jgi:hypothetical protein
MGGLLWRLEGNDAWLVAEGLGHDAPALAYYDGSAFLAVSEAAGAVWQIDVHASAQATVTRRQTPAGFTRPVDVAVIPNGGGVLIADWGAQCVWELSGTDWYVAYGAIGVAGSGLDATKLANPSLLAVLSTEVHAVGDGRALWSTDASGLHYVCGGGTQRPGTQAMACANVDWAGSHFTSLALAYAGGDDEHAAFLLSPSYGVWMIPLLPAGAPMTLRPLRAAHSGDAMLVWSGLNLLLTRNNQVLAGAVTAFTQLSPTPALQCACDAGLYCNATRQECMPAPAGHIAPAWTDKPRACAIGTIARNNLCQPCHHPNAFTTYTAGAFQCERRCGNGQLFRGGQCVPGCNASNGEYQTVSSPPDACARASAPR